MELYNVARGSYIRLLPNDGVPAAQVPPSARGLPAGEVLYFDHVDGMYSFCRDAQGGVVHPAAWSEVEVVDKPADWK